MPGIAAPSMTIVSWARTSRITKIDGMAAAIVAAMTNRTIDTWLSLLLDGARRSVFLWGSASH